MVETQTGTQALRRAWVEIDLQALKRNYGRLRDRVSPARILAVVKADAYGHGAVAVARALEPEGVAGFAVATAEEAIELRQAGVAAAILVLSPLPPDAAETLHRYDLTPVISSLEGLAALQSSTRGGGWVAPLHLKFDTGMTRLGIDFREAATVIERVRSAKSLRLEGVMSHLAEAETPESESNRLQQERFEEVLALLTDRERSAIKLHLANSAAALHLPAARYDWVRLGIALYGYDSAGRLSGELEAVLSVEAEIVQIKEIPEGTRVGYGGRWTATRHSRIAIVPVGYADGYSWRLGNRAQALVRGQRVSVVGSISMDLLALDITDCRAEVGDRATLLGRQGGEAISAVELAADVDTIPYQLLCLFGLRLPRRAREAMPAGKERMPSGQRIVSGA